MNSSQTTLVPSTRYASIEAWAKALGSAAKTRAGQRKAIIASFARPLQGRIYREGYRPSRFDLSACTFYLEGKRGPGSQSAYLARRTRARQERFAASHPLTVSMPAPATREQVEGQSGIEYPLLTVQEDRPYGAFARVGEWVIRTQEDVSYDRSYYSKSYTAKYGGKKEVGRTILIRRVKPDGTLETRDQAVDGWRGNYLLGALITAGILEAHKGQMNVRLHPAYALDVVRAGRHLKIYARSLAGQTVDFCAVAGDVTFHAPTVKEAIQGLREKMRRSALKAKGHLVNLALGRELGFCESGMRAFADAVGLSVKGDYTGDQIADACRQHPDAVTAFLPELRVLARATGYSAPELGVV